MGKGPWASETHMLNVFAYGGGRCAVLLRAFGGNR